MNKVILMGRLTRDPDVRYTQGSEPMAVARYTLAVDRRFSRDKEKGEADFISCVAFGRTGEFAEKYLKKGTKIAVAGRIQTGSYVNKDGVKVYTTDVVVEEHEFAESKAGSSASSYQMQGGYDDRGDGGYSQGNYNNAHVAHTDSKPEDFMNIPEDIDEDLPFDHLS